jgi:hypothetical protein
VAHLDSQHAAQVFGRERRQLAARVLEEMIAPHCSSGGGATLRHAAAIVTLQHAATRCDGLQHAATGCNTLQQTATRCSTAAAHAAA